MESLSDHRYILISLIPGDCEISHTKRKIQRGREKDKRQEDTHHPRWTVRKLNKDRLLAAAQAAAWAAPSEEAESWEAERRAEWFQTQMARICSAAMPRARHSGRNATYWWSPELENKRWDCVLARRKLQHRKRKKTRSNEETEQLRRQYRIALQQAIREAKTKAWDELIKTINCNSWRRPYRLVLGKLRPSPSPRTESMEPELLERILNTLFPRDSGQAPAAVHDPAESDHPAPITSAELIVAAKRMAAKNTAPDPDGVPGKAMSLALSAVPSISAGTRTRRCAQQMPSRGHDIKVLEDLKTRTTAEAREGTELPVGEQADMPSK